MKAAKTCILIAILLAGLQSAVAQTEVRIATYNIRYLNTNVSNAGDRLQKLRDVIQLLDADIIALQEIDDRAALELVFSTTDWHLVIDDNSGENQDLAFAVRSTLELPDFANNLDADPNDFLCSDVSNYYFPDNRDLLVVRVRDPNNNLEFHVMCVHAKSRYGGRATNDPRRVAATRIMVQRLKANYTGQPFVLLGDFNDNPDDESVNVLETGDPNAVAGPEEIPGQFLVNLTEPLCAAGHVSHGLKSDTIRSDDPNSADTIDPLSRMRNNRWRGTNENTGDILFDQILIPSWMVSAYVQGSCRVLDRAVAVRGNNTTRASDHVPVYADFVFTEEVCGH